MSMSTSMSVGKGQAAGFAEGAAGASVDGRLLRAFCF